MASKVDHLHTPPPTAYASLNLTSFFLPINKTRLIRCDVLPRALSFGATLHTYARRLFIFLLNTLLECEACVENAVHMIVSLLGKLAHTVTIAILSYTCSTFGMQGILLRHHCLDSGLGEGHTSQFLSTRINFCCRTEQPTAHTRSILLGRVWQCAQTD